MAIVVSEETGKIAVVADGQIERGVDVTMLRQRLQSLLLHRRRFLRKPDPQLT